VFFSSGWTNRKVRKNRRKSMGQASEKGKVSFLESGKQGIMIKNDAVGEKG